MVFLVKSIRIEFKSVFTPSLLFHDFNMFRYQRNLSSLWFFIPYLPYYFFKVLNSFLSLEFYEIVPPRVALQQYQQHNLFPLAWLTHLEVEYQPKLPLEPAYRGHDSISSLLLWRQLWTERVSKFLNWFGFRFLQIQQLFKVEIIFHLIFMMDFYFQLIPIRLTISGNCPT